MVGEPDLGGGGRDEDDRAAAGHGAASGAGDGEGSGEVGGDAVGVFLLAGAVRGLEQDGADAADDAVDLAVCGHRGVEERVDLREARGVADVSGGAELSGEGFEGGGGAAREDEGVGGASRRASAAPMPPAAPRMMVTGILLH